MKNIKTFIAILLGVIMVFPASFFANAAETDENQTMVMNLNIPTAIRNGTDEIYVDPTSKEEYPFTINSDTMVPVRMFQNFGADVDWKSETEPIKVTLNGITVTVVIGSNSFTVTKNGNTTQTEMPQTAMYVEGKTYLPYRAICESLGLFVEWIELSHCIIVSTEKLSKEKIDDLMNTKVIGFEMFTGVKSIEINKNKKVLELKNGTGVSLDREDLVTFTLNEKGSVKKKFNKKLLFKSENSDIATVTSQGRIVGVKAGETNIIVSSHNGKTAKIKVTVK